MKFIKQAVNATQPPMDEEGINATFGDTVISDGEDKRLCAGFFHLDKTDKPLVYTYDYEEMKYVAAGEFIITDGAGEKVHATIGDVLYFENGETITFETPTKGSGFFVGQREPL